MRHHDLVIVGAGSGNSILTPEHDSLDVAIVERDLFGGTCLNRGCVPSKMFVYAADVAESARHGARLGVHTHFERADWPAIRDRVFGRIDPIVAGGEAYRHSLPNVTVYKASAAFVGPKQLAVGDDVISGDQFVLAAGARVCVPEVPGLATSGFHTSDSIMRIDALPQHLIVIGGGYIAAEMAHVFGGLGSEVTIVNRSPTLLRIEDDDIRQRFTAISARRFEVLLSAEMVEVRRRDALLDVVVQTEGGHRTVTGDCLLVATGRVPNGDDLMVQKTGVALDSAGFVMTDQFLETDVAGIWALGDITNPAMLKHTANAEARVVGHNLVHPDAKIAIDRRFVPHAVFGNPQVASVGSTERELSDLGIPYVVSQRDYASTAYGWAMEDTESFCKLLAHRDSRQLLGAHLIGPQASTLIQQLIQGMRFGQTVDQMAHDQLYIHPALSEVVEQALLGL